MAGDAAPEIELRPWSPDDLDLMVALLGDPAMTEYLGGPETPEALRKRLDRYLAMTPAEGRMFVIAVGPRRQPAGSVGYWPHESGSLETGWSVLPAFQGRGVATRGTSQCLDIAAAVGGSGPSTPTRRSTTRRRTRSPGRWASTCFARSGSSTPRAPG